MATNNNLIPINIKDLPKLDILSNSDLIPIETVEGTATILYRDFIIDEAHTTFAATLSASVTNAVALSSAIDTTNATVKTVSASLYSSITGLSSSNNAYSNALSSNIITLNATVTALSSNLYALSSSALSDITTLSSSYDALNTTVNGLNNPKYYGLNTGIGTKGSGTTTPYFTLPAGLFSLETNSVYKLVFTAFYTKTTTNGTVTFGISSTEVMNFVTGKSLHSAVADADVTYRTLSGAMANDTNVYTLTLPATPTLTSAKKQFADIEFVIDTGSGALSAQLTVNCGAGDITPLLGSNATVIKLT